MKIQHYIGIALVVGAYALGSRLSSEAVTNLVFLLIGGMFGLVALIVVAISAKQQPPVVNVQQPEQHYQSQTPVIIMLMPGQGYPMGISSNYNYLPQPEYSREFKVVGE